MDDATLKITLFVFGSIFTVLGVLATRQLNQIDENIKSLWQKYHQLWTLAAKHDTRITILEREQS